MTILNYLRWHKDKIIFDDDAMKRFFFRKKFHCFFYFFEKQTIANATER